MYICSTDTGRAPHSTTAIQRQAVQHNLHLQYTDWLHSTPFIGNTGTGCTAHPSPAIRGRLYNIPFTCNTGAGYTANPSTSIQGQAINTLHLHYRGRLYNTPFTCNARTGCTAHPLSAIQRRDAQDNLHQQHKDRLHSTPFIGIKGQVV
jgi:hypothetical protein